MLKKSLIMLLCLSLTASLFVTGCGKKDTESKKEKTEAVDSAEETGTKPNYKVVYFDGDDGIYAEVEGEKITSDELKYFLMMEMQTEYSAAGEDAGDDFWTDKKIKKSLENALNQVVLMHLYKKGAEDAGVTLSDEDTKTIEENLVSVKEYYGEEMYNLQLEAMGITEDMYKTFSTLSMYASNWYQKYTETAVSDEEIEKIFFKDYVKAKHILISKTGENGEDISVEARSKIEEIKKQLDSGSDFDTLMKENSEDPGLETAPDGYVFTKGQMVQPFEDAAYALEPDQISDIVESDYGFHILKKVALTKEDLDETTSDSMGQQTTMRDSIKSSISGEKFNEHVEDFKSKVTVKVNKKEEKKFKKDAEKLYTDFIAKVEEVSAKLQEMQQAQQSLESGDDAASETADGE